MDRSIPVFNKLVISQTQKRNHESHLRRLSSIRYGQRRAATSLRNPQLSMRYTEYNPKKEQMEEERRTEIEKQNIMLYNKMTKILNRSKNKSESSNYLGFRESKIREINKINQENKEIVKRLEKQRPTISNKKLHQQHKKKEKLLKFMGSYPYKYKFNNTSCNINSNNPIFHNSISIQGRNSLRTPSSKTSQTSKLERKFEKMQQAFRKTTNNVSNTKNDLPAVKQTKEFPSRQSRYQNQQPSQSINLYRKNIMIDNQVFQVVILRLHNQYQFKLYDQNSYCYRLVIPEAQGNKILTDYDYDFGFISSCLKIKNDKLSLNIDKQRDINENYRVTTPENRVSINESKLKNYKLQQQIIEDNPEIVPKSEQITRPQPNFSKQTHHNNTQQNDGQ